MYQVLIPYPFTDKAAVTISADVAIGTATPVGRVGVLLGSANVVSGALLMRRVEQAIHSLMNRIHNSSKGQVAVRVEAYHDESDAVFHNAAGLSNNSFAAACFNLADADEPQSTELLYGAFAKLVAVAREKINDQSLVIQP